MKPAALIRRAILLAICPALLLPASNASAAKRPAVTAGIDKSARAIRADLSRMFPRTKYPREDSDSFSITADTPSSKIDSIEARPEVYRIDNGVKMVRLEPSPIFGKFLRYMFPRWRRADVWLAHSFEITRHTMCPKIAHIGNAWVILRGEFIEVLGYVRAELIVTRLAPDQDFWKEAREIQCDGPPVIDEIR